MATITKVEGKNGLRWRAQIRIRRGGVIVYSQTYTSAKRSQVEAWAKKREAELAEPGALERMQQRGVTVGAVLSWYESWSNAAAGRSKLAQVKFLQGCEIADLDALALTVGQVVDHAHARRAGGAGPSTVGQDLTWLSLAFKGYRLTQGVPVAVEAVADAQALLRQSKTIGRGRQRDRRPTIAEMDSLMNYFEGRDGRAIIPMAEIVPFAMFSGRRADEICRIRWADLDDRRRAVFVRGMKHPREKRDTWVFLTDEAWAIIQRQARIDERIFPYDSRSVSAAFTRSCSFLEILDLRFHDLRHECASWLFEREWDIPKVAGVTGHKSWASLQRYTHVREHGYYDKWEDWRWRPACSD